MNDAEIQRLIQLDHAHLWHPFTPMRQWRQTDPVIIERAEGDELIDVRGNRYIDGVSSLWCNIHGHRVEKIDAAVRAQLDLVAHSTLLGLANVPAVRLAAKLVRIAPTGLNKVFFTDSGATATEVAFKMAVGYWHHRRQPQRHLFVALSGAYHGDTVGAMSVGYSDLFHRPYQSMTFRTQFVAGPEVRAEGEGRRAEGQGPRAEGKTSDASAARDSSSSPPPLGPGPSSLGPSSLPLGPSTPPLGPSSPRIWPLEDEVACAQVRDRAVGELDDLLETIGETVAAIVIEPLVQGAAGMVMHPPGYLRAVADLAKKYGTLLIADEVATGFGRTGRMFASQHEDVTPDILCLGKGLTGGYLPVAATLCTDDIEQAFCGELHEHKTLYHGHTFTGNPLGCAAALASIELMEETNLLHDVEEKAHLLARCLDPLRDPAKFPHVLDVRQRGLMVGIELNSERGSRNAELKTPNPELETRNPKLETRNSSSPLGPRPSSLGPVSPSSGSSLGDFGESADRYARRIGHEVCMACRADGVLVRPLGNVVVLMPPLAIKPTNLRRLADVVIHHIAAARPR